MFCTIQLSKSDPTPLYIQLATELSRLIKSGVFPANTKLPTIRSLSKKLNINRDTVVSAYKLLENQSLVIGHIGSGTYVAPLYTSISTPPLDPPITCSAINFPKSYFPPTILKHLMNDIIETDGWSIFLDPLQRHKSALRQVIVTYFQSLGIESTGAQVRLLDDLHSFWVNLLKLHPNPCICIEEYYNPSLVVFLKSLGLKVFEIPLTTHGMDLEYLKDILNTHDVSFICTSSYIQNPTSVCYSSVTKGELLDLATQYNCYIVDDITYIDFCYHQVTIDPLFSLDRNERVIALHHFSKVYLPYLNYSFVTLPPHLSKKFPSLNHYTLNEHVLYYYLQSDHFSSLRVDLLEKSRMFHALISDVLSSLSNKIQTYSFEGGLSFFIKPLDIECNTFINHFLEYGIIISPSEVFSTKFNENYFRISISHLNDIHCKKLIDCLLHIPS